ncbi:hypothetical protein ACI6QG_05345 [Roseococcus sp. DSY-14]|uniref:hypothetical protein n=1 Tax=Roseococcus sp. DSY-14 TaxID=3369650 RepID=UPI00387B4441
MKRWFEAQLEAAFAIFNRGDFADAILPTGVTAEVRRRAQVELFGAEAVAQLDTLSSESPDYSIGRAVAKGISGTRMSGVLRPGTQGFALLEKQGARHEALVWEGRVAWANGEIGFRPPYMPLVPEAAPAHKLPHRLGQ